jgi:predicted permease
MQQIQAIFAVTFPFFALVLCGYLAVRRGMLPIDAISGLSAFVLYFALSAMLFHFGAATPFAELINVPLIVVYTLGALILIAGVVTLSLNERVGVKDAAFGAMAVIYSNSGFMGIPLLVALLGQKAVGVIILTLLIDQVILSTVIMVIAHAKAPTGAARGPLAWCRPALAALKSAAKNPLPWAIVAGILFGLSGLVLPAPVDKTIALLSDSASPVALFTIGAMLARNVARSRTQPQHGPSDYLPLALAKLFAHPLIFFLGGLAAQALGHGLGAEALTTLILIAALPSAGNVSMLAERFGADGGRIASVIMTSTVLSFLTFSAMVWLLGVRPPGA